jgi:hypothetical protein
MEDFFILIFISLFLSEHSLLSKISVISLFIIYKCLHASLATPVEIHIVQLFAPSVFRGSIYLSTLMSKHLL